MIQTKDFRIGNYIWQYVGKGHDEELKRVYKVEQDSINGLIPQAISPVKLTEEWLRIAGFKKSKDEYLIKHPNGIAKYVLLHRGSWVLSLERFTPNEDVFDTVTRSMTAMAWNIDTVHQLQNLYHSLTGTELEIKEMMMIGESDEI